MKKLIALLLITSSMYSQKQVFNVQRYCIDELPFKTNSCDISGNEYSFVFLDSGKQEVVFFLTSQKLKYAITDSKPDTSNPDFTIYGLKNEQGTAVMKINKQKNKIEFLYPDKHIYLTVGKSTKAVQ